MKKQEYDWQLRLAREVWRDVRDLPGLAWTGAGSPEILVVGDEGLAARLWADDGGMMVVKGGDDGGTLGEDVRYDRVAVTGGLEVARDGKLLLEQVVRVLRPDGVVLVVVANRTSPWVWWGSSPWSEGRPYSKNQLEELAVAAGLKIMSCNYGVLVPPSRSRVVWRLRGVWRTLMGALLPALGGVIVLVAGKEVGGAKGLKVDSKGGGVTPVPVGVSLRVRRGEGV